MSGQVLLGFLTAYAKTKIGRSQNQTLPNKTGIRRGVTNVGKINVDTQFL